jgi:hypothetical protein
MNRIKWIVLAALGCGDMADVDPVIDRYPEPAEPAEPAADAGAGLIELPLIIDYVPGSPEADAAGEHASALDAAWQAALEGRELFPIDKTTYTIPSGYGIQGDRTPCNPAGFVGGVCDIPKAKTNWCVFKQSNTETPPAGMQAAATTALAAWESFVEARGWSVTQGTMASCLPPPGQPNHQIRWKFGNLCNNCMGALGPVVDTGDIISTTPGQVRPWTHANITLDPSEITEFPGYSSKEQTVRDLFVRNIMIHELFHAAGLAHNGLAGSLMDVGPLVPPQLTEFFSKNMVVLAAEATMINSFKVQ